MEKLGSALYTLGLLLQLNGVMYFVPIMVAFYFGELVGVASFSFMALILLSLGFLLTTTYKSEEHDYFSLALTILLTFTVLSLIGSIPYIMMSSTIFGTLDTSEIIVNSIFDSVSGFTTTGLTTIKIGYEDLPKSLVVFRSLSQWLGGVNILFIVTLFFTGTNLPFRIIPQLMGIERIKTSVKRSLVEVIKLYSTLTVAFIAALILFGTDPFVAFNVVMTAISTGGFSPVSRIESALSNVGLAILVICMAFGAVNFSIYESFLRRQTRRIYLGEVLWWLGMTGFLALILLTLSQSGRSISHLFNLISGAATAGFQIGDIRSYSNLEKVIFAVAMFIGGNTFSTAGGFKTLRLMIIARITSWYLDRLTLPSTTVRPLRLSSRDLREEELYYTFTLLILGMSSVLTGAAILVATNGSTLADALFESVSAWSNTGLSVGLSQSSNIAGKVALSFLMIIGRVEVLPLLSIFGYLVRVITLHIRRLT